MTTKKLYRSENDYKISGVCGGIAEYFAVDATLIRLLWVLLTLCSGVGIGVIAYVACAVIIPKDPGCIDADFEEKK